MECYRLLNKFREMCGKQIRFDDRLFQPNIDVTMSLEAAL